MTENLTPLHLVQLIRGGQLTSQQIENLPATEDQAGLSRYLDQSLQLPPDQLKTGLGEYWQTLPAEEIALALDQSVKIALLALKEASLNPEKAVQLQAVADTFVSLYEQYSTPPTPTPAAPPTEMPAPSATPAELPPPSTPIQTAPLPPTPPPEAAVAPLPQVETPPPPIPEISPSPEAAPTPQPSAETTIQIPDNAT
ncbi:hypothetical protein A3B45_03630 [Candidatus Daviesbacteria bacterium RIFCSPLOWO2_01_FULL_39_12]|uniref:Uncharacterized protein n=1 Tax=Candidatus Daviesbacteria bacterium RIFCSPLOWO2_01_FULL_39_12 TaxID=1797785 RepID=A0A1F5KU45_9BACT|nr:MAG: hypothetical protein A3B45_03630 [Candidatus Daviesbacteria bacterium RIFCSPLOWO2_01_FULL_39_12]